MSYDLSRSNRNYRKQNYIIRFDTTIDNLRNVGFSYDSKINNVFRATVGGYTSATASIRFFTMKIVSISTSTIVLSGTNFFVEPTIPLSLQIYGSSIMGSVKNIGNAFGIGESNETLFEPLLPSWETSALRFSIIQPGVGTVTGATTTIMEFEITEYYAI